MTDFKGTGAKEVLRTFFAPENNILSGDRLKKEKDTVAWANRLLDGDNYTVLPRFDPQTKQIRWYGIARSERSLRQLGEDLKSFLGLSFAELIDMRVALDMDDPLENALHRFSEGRILRFRADNEHVRAALNTMFAVRDAQPARSAHDSRSPGLLLRSFATALKAGDETAAREALSVLRETGILDAANERYLQVELLSRFGQWEALLEVRDLPELMALRRPAAVTDALVQAVFHVHLADAVRKDEVEEALRITREEVRPAYDALLADGSGLRSPEAWTVLALVAAAEQDTEAWETAHVSIQRVGGDASFIELLAPQVEEKETAEPTREQKLLLKDAIDQADWKSAADIAATLRDGPQKAQALLQAAVFLNTLEAKRRARQAVDALSAEERETLMNHAVLQGLIERLSLAQEEQAPPSGWNEWLVRLLHDPSWSRSAVVRAAQHGAQEWDASTLTEGTSTEEVVALIGRIPNEHVEPFTTSLVYLLDALQADPKYPDPALAPLYRVLLEHLVLADTPGLSHFEVSVDLMPAVLAFPMADTSYREVVGYPFHLLKELRSPGPVARLLDLLDALIVYSCPDTEARIRGLIEVSEQCRQYQARWETEDVALLHQFASELDALEILEGISVAEIDVEYEDPLSRLSGTYVAIYTLTEPASQRARDLLEKVAPGVRVEVSHAHVANDRLRSMAREADYFVMVTASAKHAATGFITTHRGDRDLIRPPGKGTASLIRSLRRHLHEQQSG